MNVLHILIGLQVADLITTAIALTRPGLHEANPFLANLFNRFGVLPTLVIAKGALIAALWYLQAYIHPYALIALVVMYAYVVFNNTRLIFKW